tara:strand:- start:2382 stop:2948 length:567 start_codon:yes stop_codon:yes gene_type:complete
MDKVINDFTNMAATIVERMILAMPGPESPHYLTMLGALAGLLALLVIWLVLRLRRAHKISQQPVKDETEITFSDVTAEAAADAQAALHHDNAATLEDIAGAPARAPLPDDTAHDEVSQPAAGFKFFKRRSKAGTGEAGQTDPDDDVFLLGLEQEMLATRQLYLDGLISKEVYVTETRALYDKAQTRMT